MPNRDADVSPMKRLYRSFIIILQNITIKYTFKAEALETMETKFAADEYFLALEGKTSFYHYSYTPSELDAVGLLVPEIREEVLKGNLSVLDDLYVELPDGTKSYFKDLLLANKRQMIIDNFEEKNDYYRVLNGYPELADTEYYYINNDLATQLGISRDIPIHKIQDYYNKIEPGLGDYYISVIENSSHFQAIKASHPDKEYLNYIGSSRIDLKVARQAKNFSLLQIKKNKNVREAIYEQFIRYYDMCRDYFMKVIYMPDFRTFMEYYDNFIAMGIMVMTVLQILVRQIELGVKREFFDLYAVKALYEAYDIPYNLYIDEETQQDIVQNLNLLIQNKATNKVLYDIANLLGFPNLSIYKYYLAKQQKYDKDGLPIIQTTEKFNVDTGEMETVYDYEAMYRVYFMKEELRNQDFISTFNDASNETPYKELTGNDPFWIEDTDLYNKLWESEYNFVESKYLGIGISYSMTDIVMENIVLLKLIMQKKDEIDDLHIQLPRITGSQEIPLFDIIILLVCLTAAKHNLNGEIITNPAQLIHVLDNDPDADWRNLIGVDIYDDTLSIDYSHYYSDGLVKYFLDNPDGTEVDEETADEAIHRFLHETDSRNYEKFLVDTFQINFDYLLSDECTEQVEKMRTYLGDEDFEKLISYVSILTISGSIDDKIEALNQMYSNIKNLYKWLNYKITNSDNRLEYEHLKEIYNTIFYSKEMKEVFEIQTELAGKRTAFDYFEYLYYRNPGLYKAVFDFDMYTEYKKYLDAYHYTESDFSYDEFKFMMEDGSYIKDPHKPVFYNLKDTGDMDDDNTKEQIIYGYVNHIISRLEMILNGLSFMYLLNDTATPLQQLLEKLILFFKSFTVDMVQSNMLFICDLKTENLLKFFDELTYLSKWIEPHDKLNFPYADAIHRITSLIKLDDKTMRLNDILYYLDAMLIKENKKVRDNKVLVDGVEMFEYEWILYIINKKLNNQELTEEEQEELDNITNDRIRERHVVFVMISEDKESAILTLEDKETKFIITPDYESYPNGIKPSSDFIYYNMAEKFIFPDNRILPYPSFTYDNEYEARFSKDFNECEIMVDGEWTKVLHPNSRTAYYTFNENGDRVDYFWNGSFYTATPVYMYRPYKWDEEQQKFVKDYDIITNSIRLTDELIYFKTIEVHEKLSLYDGAQKISTDSMVKDRFGFRDGIARKWYTDAE